MYIPQQHTLPRPATSASVVVEVPTPIAFVLRTAIPSAQAENNTTRPSSASFNNGAITFVGVLVTVLVLLIVLLVWTFCRKGVHNQHESDTTSTSSESDWRIDPDPDSPDLSAAAKHDKRLKTLEQVAPAQSLGHWRAEKQETHVQTFATASTRLFCAICIDLIEDSDRIRELHCGHVYHSACLNLWVERGHHDCPLCKYDILELQQQAMKIHELDDTEPAEGQHQAHQDSTRDGVPIEIVNEQPVQAHDS
ncbi:hypothetical protein PV11_00409 [Exophiala sideris]|uniref:RING-type domain-containing protein n=1 Tax=Exophiala sideris TaxID=1016849 RepID=A0A0D1X9W2_9EURO|nr:hypothetical protein PV11_00409 [Exophiala sideris]